METLLGSKPRSFLWAHFATGPFLSKNQEKDYTISMENAEASVCMEGYTVTPEMREQCERVLWGEATGTTWLVWHYAKMIKYGKGPSQN